MRAFVALVALALLPCSTLVKDPGCTGALAEALAPPASAGGLRRGAAVV